MSIAYVQQVHSAGFGSSASLTLTPTAGNFIWVIIAASDPVNSGYPTGISDNQSNSYVFQQQRNDQSDTYLTYYLVYAAANSSSTSISISFGSSIDYACAALEYSGMEADSGGNLSNQTDNGNFVTSGDSGSLFIFSSPGMCIAAVLTDNIAGGTITHTGSFNERVNISSAQIPLSVADLMFSSTGSKSTTWSFNGSCNYQAAITGWKVAPPPVAKPGMLLCDTVG